MSVSTDKKLHERDWLAILDSILRINSVENVNLLETVSLEIAGILAPNDQALFFVTQDPKDRNKLGRVVVRGKEAYFLDAYLAGEFDDEDDSDLLFSGRHVLSHHTEVSRDSDRIPEDYLVGTKIYRQVYAKQGLHYAMRATLIDRRKFVGVIELYRSKEHGDFTDKQLKMVEILAPHIASRLRLLLKLETETMKRAPSVTKEQLRETYGLTKREEEIVILILDGKEGPFVSKELCIAEATFRKHLYNAYKKLGVSSRSQLYDRFRTRAVNRELPDWS